MYAGDQARRQHGAFLGFATAAATSATTPSARTMFTGGLQRGLHQLNGFITRAQFGCDCRDCGRAPLSLKFRQGARDVNRKIILFAVFAACTLGRSMVLIGAFM